MTLVFFCSIVVFAHNSLACGSMVCIFLVGHFSPAGRKMTHKELNIFGERKS
jgi:hypothetical protein